MPPASDLFIAQPITFHSMKRAQQQASDVSVKLMTTQYAEDHEIIPEYFQKCTDLEKQMGDFQNFKVHRKLPVIHEILDRLTEHPADYYIYTNADISLRPSFYQFVVQQIEADHDAFVINRRTIDKSYSTIEEYHQMCEEAGERHPGFDCFIFKSSILDKFKLGNAGLGANWIGRVIITNLIMHANNFKIFEDEFQTFHIGDDRSWKNPDYADYDEFNRQEMIKILLHYRSLPNISQDKLEYLNRFLYKDMKWNGDGANPYLVINDSEKSNGLFSKIKNKVSNWLK